MKNKKISIIVCCYNQGEYLKETLECCFNQTYKEKEIVLINDGSTDNTHDVALEYKDRDNFVYIKQKNKGLGVARNEGIKAASGDFVFILDADDIIRKNYLKKAFSLVKNKNTVVWPMEVNFIDDLGTAKPSEWQIPNNTLEDELNEFTSLVSILGSKENFIKCGLYLTERKYMQITDYDMSLKLRSIGCEFVTVKNPWYFYRRVHDGSMTLNNWFQNRMYYYNTLKYKLHTDLYEAQIRKVFLEILNRKPTHIEFMNYFEKLTPNEYGFREIRRDLKKIK